LRTQWSSARVQPLKAAPAKSALRSPLPHGGLLLRRRIAQEEECPLWRLTRGRFLKTTGGESHKRSAQVRQTPDRHLPQRIGLGRVMTDYKIPKNTERHDYESGPSRSPLQAANWPFLGRPTYCIELVTVRGSNCPAPSWSRTVDSRKEEPR
jgi:hypothetical protein